MRENIEHVGRRQLSGASKITRRLVKIALRLVDFRPRKIALDRFALGDGLGEIVERLAVGNVYVNRNMIGAVVGVQPFGGHGLSGTGPKAGGPHYLTRFATEQTVTVNTAAAGGNAALMSGEE